MGVNVKAVLGSVAACGVLLLVGCSSGTTASAPTTAEAVPVPEKSTAAPAPSAPMSSAPAPAPAAVVLATWTCAKDGEEVTCTCEGSESDCRLAVAEPSPVKGATGQVRWFNNDMGYGFITADNGRNVFVLLSAVLDSGLKGLEDGQRIQFQLQENGYKVMAVNIKLL